MHVYLSSTLIHPVNCNIGRPEADSEYVQNFFLYKKFKKKKK